MIQPPDWTAPWIADDRCMQHQAAQSEIDLEDWLAGGPHAAFDAFRTLMTPIADSIQTFIEIGSGCGYGLKVLKSFAPDIVYVGFDFSESMLAYAREKYLSNYTLGGANFVYGSAENIPLSDNAVGCVCLAAVIQHVPDWKACIREAIRVSKQWVMVHRFEGTVGFTFEYKNEAYDTEIPTRIINEQEFLLFCDESGLKLSRKVRWGRNEEGRFNSSMLWEKK